MQINGESKAHMKIKWAVCIELYNYKWGHEDIPLEKKRSVKVIVIICVIMTMPETCLHASIHG